MGGVIMMVEQSLTLVLVMVYLFVSMLARSEEERRRERREDPSSGRGSPMCSSRVLTRPCSLTAQPVGPRAARRPPRGAAR